MGATGEAAFKDLKKELISAVGIAYVKENHYMTVFTNASDIFWTVIVAELKTSELATELQYQRNKSFVFLS